MLALTTKIIFITRDVIFYENVFPFSTIITDFTDPFFPEVDTIAEGGLDTFVTLVSIPDMTIDSCEPCAIFDHSSTPITSSSMF